MAINKLSRSEIDAMYEDFAEDEAGKKQQEVYGHRFKAFQRGKRRHAAERENFFLLCMVAHGDFNVITLQDRDDYYTDFEIYRAIVHPDYYINPALPILELDDYIQWYREQKGLGELEE